MRNCELCGTPYVPNRAGRPQKFCSKYCKDRASHLRSNPRIPRPCGHCGGPISDKTRTDAQFCTNRCRELAHYATHGPADRLRKFGLTPETFAELLAEQGGTCAIDGCEIAIDANGRRLHVDHDHACCPGRKSCGECIRGILCNRHNVGIGMFGDDPTALRAAAAYLEATARPRLLAV